MKRAMILGMAMAVCGAGSAHAQQMYDILILPETYFPETTYLKPGDRVKFINMSDDEHTIVAANEAWTIGPIQAEAHEVLVVGSDIERTFHNANAINSDGSYAVTGDISFDDPPIE